MCGIAGRAGQAPEAGVGEAFTKALGHRGPDGHGNAEAVGEGWAWELASTRLAIVDLSEAGSQPVTNEDGSLEMVFNGEIYNAAELRRWCEQKGHHFRSRMDGEVILHLYELEGERAFARLNGIFAVAIASRATGEVVLARDPLGVKPLFHTTSGRELWFASEIQALRAAGAPVGAADLVAAAQFLTFLWVPDPRTPLTGVRSLPAGAVLRWTPPGRTTESRHTDLVAEAVATPMLAGEPAEQEVAERIDAAVQRQLRADVPVGLMASGGVDSTLIWHAAGPSLNRVFSVAWQGHQQTDGLDADLAAVQTLSQLTGVPLQEVNAPQRASDEAPPSGDLLADPAAELTGALSHAARAQGMKVLLSGLGGDELFAGYRRHVVAPWLERLPTVPAAAVAERLLRRTGSRSRTAEYAARALRAVGQPDRFVRYLTLCSYSEASDRAALLGCTEGEVADDVVWGAHREVYDRLPASWSLLRAGRLLDLCVYLPGLGLTYADRAGMAESVEIRVPYLDLELVRWALTLPDRALVHRGQAKPLTKEVVAAKVSPALAHRAKRGFGLPTATLQGSPNASERGFRQGAYFGHATRVLANVEAQLPGRSAQSRAAASTTKVLVNATSARLGGGLSYLRRQLAALERVRPDLDLVVLAAPWNVADFRAVLDAEVRLVPVPNASARYLYEQTVLPLRAPGDRVLYCPGNFGPLVPTRAPVAVALQNPNYVGGGVSFRANRGASRRLKIELSLRSMRAADRVIAISHALADDLLRDLPELAGKTEVILSGAPEWPEHEQRPDAAVGDGGHVLSLANDYRHKHLDHVLQAWVEAFADTRPGGVPRLVFVGSMTARRRASQLRRVPALLRPHVVHLGGVSDRREVRWLVAHAAVMAAPSALEAFPLTPAEAGALGCPLVLSDIPAHREVAGDHATYVPVGDLAALAEAIRAYVDEPPPREPWTWPVSWDDNARQLAAVFDALAGDRRRGEANGEPQLPPREEVLRGA